MRRSRSPCLHATARVRPRLSHVTRTLGNGRGSAAHHIPEVDMTEMISASQFHEADGTEDWRVVSDGACTFLGTDSFAQAAALVHAIGELPGVEAHRPDIDIRPDGMTIRLITVTEDAYGMSDDDVDLARQISTTARDLGLSGDPAGVQSFLVVPGALNTAEVMPFWQAVLGYQRRNDT